MPFIIIKASIVLFLGSKFQWNFNQNSKTFFQENEFENVVCIMAIFLGLSFLDSKHNFPRPNERGMIEG